LRALRTIPSLSIDLGHYLSHPVRMPLAHPPSRGPQTVEVIKTEEKGSDVNLASYLLLDAFRSDCEAAVVVSNDSDLKAPIELAKAELGLVVGVVNPHPPARRSRALRPTFWRQVRERQLQQSQFPSVLTDAKGTFRKPLRW
jgi:NYN domain